MKTIRVGNDMNAIYPPRLIRLKEWQVMLISVCIVVLLSFNGIWV